MKAVPTKGRRLIPRRQLTGPAFAVILGMTATAAWPQLAEKQRPELSFYGLPGLMDMPNADMMPDGELTLGISSFAGMTRGTLAFQLAPRIITSFRYSGLRNWDADGFSTYYDRSFDIRLQLLTETARRPSIMIGIQDFIGTGLYSAEYIVASKTFAEKFSVTAGLGWGRFGSHGAIGSTGSRPVVEPEDVGEGGTPNWDAWFRGDFALFGGIAYRPIPNVTLKLEYSSDAYDVEVDERGLFEWDTPLNFGVEYQVNDDLRLGAYAMYGSELGASLQFALNPARSAVPGGREAAPPAVLARPSREEAPEFYATTWTESDSVKTQVRDLMYEELRLQGMEMEALTLTADSATVYLRNGGFLAPAQAVGRTLRIMSRLMPSSVENFIVIQMANGVELPGLAFTRTDVEKYETEPDGAEQMLARVAVETEPQNPPKEDFYPGVYPRFNWSFGPYARTSLFDPDNPFRIDLGLQLSAGYTFSPGVLVAGTVQKKVVGNLDSSTRPSDSVLPHVRSDFALYDKYGDPAIRDLFGAYYFQPGREVYGRVTAGYLERMFAGVSTELLWAPYSTRYALGAELNYVRQRDYNGGFGLFDYTVATGHASVYWRVTDDFLGRVSAGRYLAGDYGATFALDRVFANGWRVGAFATFTDVSSEDFGEGSFDKGILLSIPIDWLLGRPTRHVSNFTVRPVTRDGGAVLEVPGRLFNMTEDGRRYRQEDQWGRLWR